MQFGLDLVLYFFPGHARSAQTVPYWLKFGQYWFTYQSAHGTPLGLIDVDTLVEIRSTLGLSLVQNCFPWRAQSLLRLRFSGRAQSALTRV